MKSIFTTYCLLFLFALSTQAQHKIEPDIRTIKKASPNKQLKINPIQLDFDVKPTGVNSAVYKNQIDLKNTDRFGDLAIIKDNQSERILAIKGASKIKKSTKDPEARALEHLKNIAHLLEVNTPEEEFRMVSKTEVSTKQVHHKFQQYYKGIKVLDAQINTQQKNGEVYFVNGNWEKSPSDINTKPSLDEKSAVQLVIDNLDNFQYIPTKFQRLVNHEQIKPELVIASHDGKQLLAWHIDIFESISEHWNYTIDAHTGAVLDKHSVVCMIDGHTHANPPTDDINPPATIVDGKTTSVGRDLFNEPRNINVYECGNAFFLADAGRSMFHGNESDCTNDDLLIHGVIMTWDALGTSPSTRNFNYNYSLTTQRDVWNDRTAISAHYNGGEAYEYFLNTFGRESINGDRGNIESFYNVRDENGQEMDNAFWTGSAIFYGNGNQAFIGPLAAGLDVAGHEMSHGVVQTTANLRYQGESGALNESFADVFGALIERETWEIGEDVVNPQIFPSGALRNMANPNNGGRSLSDTGYQPASVSEQFFGQEDNGGVHINSGIPNRAFFLFATNEDVGVEAAEQVYYKVLTQYLTPRSQFVDLRTAVIEVAGDDIGQAGSIAAAQAFDAVGIVGEGVIRQNIPEREIEVNPGSLDLILWSDEDFSTINFSTDSGNFSGISFERPHISKPSVSDNGRFITFVNANRQAQLMEIDWNTGELVNDNLLFDGVRNVVISKDGTRLAALTGNLSTGEFDNLLFVIDLVSGAQEAYELFNPTFTDGISTGEVLFADAMEFDLAGENVLYDAFNFSEGSNGIDLSYWDIGIIKVWENDTGLFEEAGNNIFKVFTGLPENVSVGNPTFSKTNPDVIAFDLREIGVIAQDTTFEILGANLNTGEVDVIFENNIWGYPNYSIDDTEVIFSFDNGPQGLIIGRRPVASNRITGTDDALIFIDDRPQWGVWFGTGNRDLLSDTDDPVVGELDVFPNPAQDQILIDLPADFEGDKRIELFSYDGKRMLSGTINSFDQRATVDISAVPNGSYILKLSTKEALFTEKIVILR